MTKRVRKVLKRVDKDVFDWSGSVQSKDGKQKELRYTVEAIGEIEQSLNSFLRSVIEKILKSDVDEISEDDVKEVVAGMPLCWFNRDTDLLDGCSQPHEIIERLSQSYAAEVSSDEDDEEPVVKKKLNLSLSKGKRQINQRDFEGNDFSDSFVMGFSQSLFDAPLPSVSNLFTPPQDVNPDELIQGLSNAPTKKSASFIEGLSPIREDVARKSKPKNLVKRRRKIDMPTFED